MTDEELVLDYFNNIPSVDFSSYKTINYSFPKINIRSSRHHSDGDPAAISAVTDFFEYAVRKFAYQDFFAAKSINQLCWAEESLEINGDEIAVILRSGSKNRSINKNLQQADSWFLNFVSKICGDSEPAGHCEFLIGNPGCGKSTLMKMLINRHREICTEKGVLFSRIEASKFFSFSHRLAIFTHAKGGTVEHLLKALDHYYHWAVLRDVIFAYSYSISESGRFSSDGWGFGKTKGIDEAIDRAVPFVSTEDKDQIFSAIIGEIRRKSHQFKSLLSFPTIIIKKLLNEFITMVELRSGRPLVVCVLYDGFDFFGPEETRIDHEKIITKKIILSQHDLLNPDVGDHIPSLRLSPNFRYHSLIVLRRASFDQFVRPTENDAFLRFVPQHEVASLPHDVLLLKSLIRSMQSLSDTVGVVEDSPNKNRYYRKVFDLLHNLFLRLSKFDLKFEETSSVKKINVLSMFDGNIRHCLDLTRRLLTLLQEEADLAGKLPSNPAFSDLIDFASSAESSQWARRRSYRLIEVMLFFNHPVFENALKVEHFSSSTHIGEGRRKITKNASFSGLFDNIFNYAHVPNNWEDDAHYLLLKIRILQFFDINEICTEDMIASWLNELGYDSVDKSMIADALSMLKFSGLITVDTYSCSDYRRTNRGRVLVQEIIYEPVYLEHVFHKTLFPAIMIDKIKDYNRSYSHRSWTIAAVRNYYVFASYVKYVEEKSQHGRFQAPQQFRLSGKICKSLIGAIERILGESRGAEGSQVKEILSELEAINADWRQRGILKPK